MSAGSIVIDLLLKTGSFITDTGRAEKAIANFGKTVKREFSGLQASTKSLLALTASIAGVAASFELLVHGAANFQDLSDATGAAAEDIASLQIAAATAGVSIEDVAGATNKLTKSLVGVDDESQAAGAALKAIGINIKDFKSLDPVAQYEAVGKALAGFADGAGKVAVAQALFGKQGAEQLKVFKALDDAGGRQVILTGKQIEVADNLADAQAASAAKLKLYAQAAVADMIPALTDLTNVATDLVKEFLGVDSAGRKLAGNDGPLKFAESVADAFAFAADQVLLVSRLFEISGKFIAAYAAASVALLHGNLSEARAVGSAFRADMDELDKRLTFSERLANQRKQKLLTGVRGDAFTDPRSTLFGQTKPKVEFNGADTTLAARQKKILDGQIAAIRAFATEQADAFAFANRIVGVEQQDGLISLQQFYKAESDIRELGLRAQLDALDKEAAALRGARGSAKDADRIEIDNKIADVQARRRKAVQDASQAGVIAAFDERRAVIELGHAYDDLQATIATLSGDTVGAGTIRIARQVEDARKLLAQAGKSGAAADTLGSLLTRTQDLGEAQKEYGRLVDRSRDAEEALLLAAQSGGSTELETLRAVGAARAKSLEQLGALVDKANDLALSLGTPEAIQFAEKLGSAFLRAAAEVDPLMKRLRDVGVEAGDAIANGLADAALSGQDLITTLKDIDKALARIAVNELFTKPVSAAFAGLIGGTGTPSGGGGLLGQIGGYLSGLFSGGGSSGAAGAGAYLGASGLLGAGRAGGGPVAPYSVHPIAEIRPEVLSSGGRSYLLTGSRAGSIDAAPRMSGRGGATINQTFVIPPATDRRTQQQIGAASFRAVTIASVRNN